MEEFICPRRASWNHVFRLKEEENYVEQDFFFFIALSITVQCTICCVLVGDVNNLIGKTYNRKMSCL